MFALEKLKMTPSLLTDRCAVYHSIYLSYPKSLLSHLSLPRFLFNKILDSEGRVERFNKRYGNK